jgi:hypothetical protein
MTIAVKDKKKIKNRLEREIRINGGDGINRLIQVNMNQGNPNVRPMATDFFP